jgi:adenine C2-methylase RlmN of 23S rRNA A2503 and tRNA A37
MTPKNGVTSKNEKVNWNNFHKACLLAKNNLVNTVLITGKGEPTLNLNQITQFLKRLNKYEFPSIELQTNALIFGRNFNKYKRILRSWRRNGLNTFVISIVHYQDNKNKEIYSPNQDYFNLSELVKNLHKEGFSVRLNCIMLKGYIDSIDKINGLVNFCLENKVEQLTLKPVEVFKNTQNKSLVTWTQKRMISSETLKKIQLFLEKNASRLRTLDFGGIVYDYNGQNLCITDCLSNKPLSEDLRQLIFFQDGHLRYDWRYQGAILI